VPPSPPVDFSSSMTLSISLAKVNSVLFSDGPLFEPRQVASLDEPLQGREL
jgi:hypothetical protein